MKRISLKRPKAFLGIGETAAIAAQTAAQVAALAASSATQAKAIRESAEAQATAMRKNADIQSNAIKQQTSQNNATQRQIIDIQKQSMEQQKRQYDTMNANMALMMGNTNARTEREQNKIVAKNGGKVKRKLRNVNPKTPVRDMYNDGYNMPFIITDGGYAQLLGYTPEGYAIHETIGNDHEHKHKYKGKLATGVGYEFANGGKVEGEGNQSSSTGELVLTTPTDALFLSKHNIEGFNPTKAVLNGMHPITAYNIQESLKKVSPRNYNNSYKAKCGKRVKAGSGWTSNDTMYAIGAGGNILANMFGAWMTGSANRKAASTLNKASQYATDVLVDAYGNLRGIDANILKDDAFNAPVMYAATTNASTNANPQLVGIDRLRQYALKNNRRSTLSSAVRNERAARLIDQINAEKNKIYSAQTREAMANAEANANRIQEASKINASLAGEANKLRSTMAIDLAKYNNELENSKIIGIAEARAGNYNQMAQNTATALTANAQAWGSASTNSANSLNNFANNYVNNRQNLAYAMLGASEEGLQAYDAYRIFGTPFPSQEQIDKYNSKHPDKKYTRPASRYGGNVRYSLKRF